MGRPVMIPKKVKKALNHVRKHYPGVCLVVFNSDGRWQYMDEVFWAPQFNKEIDVGILEDAQSEVDNTVGFPAVFEIQ